MPSERVEGSKENCWTFQSLMMKALHFFKISRNIDPVSRARRIESTSSVAHHLTGDKNRPTIVRSSIDIGTSSTVVEFLTELGCRMDFEYIARGYMFRKGRMKITVSKIFKVILMRFEVLRVVPMKNAVLWDLMPFGLVEMC